MKKTTSKTTKKAVLTNSKKSKQPVKKQPIKKLGNKDKLNKNPEMIQASDKGKGKSYSFNHLNMFSSLLDHFAMRAPKKVPEWFKPEMPEKPKRFDYFENVFGKYSNHEYKDIFDKYYCDEDSSWFDEDAKKDGIKIPLSLKKEVKEYDMAFDARLVEIKIWEKEYELQKWAQWSWHYAQQVLKAKPKFISLEEEKK